MFYDVNKRRDNVSKNKKIFISVICIFVICALAFALFANNKNNKFKVADDEIALQIKLDTKEDVGLIIFDYSVGEKEHSGGISNADKSSINHNDVIIQPLNKHADFDNLVQIKDLTIRFTIITEYVTPNYDNIYPKEYTKVIKTPISLNAHYGELYSITIRGDKINGYEAFLEK